MGEQASPMCSDLDDASEPMVELKNSGYADILTKLRNLQDKSEQTEYRKNVLIDGAKYMTELIEAIEEHKDNAMDRETAILIECGFQSFINALINAKMNELFKNDSTSAYEVFCLYIHLLDVSGMKNYLKRLDMHVFIKLLYGQFISSILGVIAFAVAYAKLTVADLKEPLDNQEPLLLMLNFVKDELESESSSAYSTVAQSILFFVWNYADKTIIVPNLIKVGYPEAILKWLSLIESQPDVLLPCNSADLSSQGNKSKSDAVRPLISIIHNTSRHDDGINVLNSLGAISVIKKVQSRTENSEINILCCMILALLSTPEQIKNDRKRMNNALDQLLQSVSNASKSEEYKDDGFHISEPLVVLVKLFNDDRALDYILQHAQVELDASSTLEFFVDLLLKFNETVSSEKDPLKQLTCTALVNILWSVSFQDHYQYKRQLKNNQYLMILLEKFSNSIEINDTVASRTQYVPKYIESIQTAAKGILLNIYEKVSTVNMENHSTLSSAPKGEPVIEMLVPQPIQTQHSVVDTNNSNKPMIMISYSHDDKTLCYQLEEELKRNEQFDVWIDKNYCATGDSWEHIARGIKQSQVILCLITKHYTSKSVRREVIYAIDRLDKPLLPVFVLKPDLPEWLDIRTCDLTHVRFTDEKQLERSKIAKIIETLQKLIVGSNSGTDSAPTHYEPTIPIVQPFNEDTKEDREKLVIDTSTTTAKTTSTDFLHKPIDQWDKTDIQQWWQQNGIILELYNLCQFTDGSELLSYAKVLLEDEKAQYKSYAEEFPKLYNGKTLLLHQFNKFSNALRKLTNEQDKPKLPGKSASITSPTQSRTCQIL